MTVENLKFDRRFFQGLWQLLKPYWVSEEKGSAALLLAAIIALITIQVQLNIQLMMFYKGFFDALQNYDQAFLIHLLPHFILLALGLILVIGYNVYISGILTVRWRRWLTKHYLSHWLANYAYYRIQVLNKNIDNPDQRISEDLESFPATAVSLFTSLLTSILTLIYFGRILWQLSTTPMPLGPWGTLAVPGYLLWLALLYATLGTLSIFFIGRVLANFNYLQQRYNANFRFSMMRLREASEQIALYRGEKTEMVKFHGLFAYVFDNFMRIIKIQKKLMFFQFGYNTVSYMFGLIIGMPLYLAKKIQLGGIMQISTAFGEVIGALSVLIGAFNTLANWRSVIFRLTEFNQALQEANPLLPTPRIQFIKHAKANLVIKNLNLLLPNGASLLEQLQLTVEPGERILLTGVSGVGKSTLLRAIAGIWPYGHGQVYLPQHQLMMFLPQKPYLPLGTLREALAYPFTPVTISEPQLLNVLSLCHLEALKNDLDVTRNWSNELSLGEQQLIALARVFLQAPQWLFLDEATSALDESMAAKMYQELSKKLPATALISVGHRNALSHFHKRIIELTRQESKPLAATYLLHG